MNFHLVKIYQWKYIVKKQNRTNISFHIKSNWPSGARSIAFPLYCIIAQYYIDKHLTEMKISRQIFAELVIVVSSNLFTRLHQQAPHAFSGWEPHSWIWALHRETNIMQSGQQHTCDRVLQHRRDALTRTLPCSCIGFLCPAHSVNPLKMHLCSLCWREYRKKQQLYFPSRSFVFLRVCVL